MKITPNATRKDSSPVCAVLAQSVEREAVNLEVAGSIPAYSDPPTHKNTNQFTFVFFTLLGL